MKKIGTIVIAFAALELAQEARATNGQDWTGGGEDTLYSNSANWQGGRTTDSTAAVRFDTQGGKTVTFDGNYATADYLWVGSTTAGNYATRADDGTWTVTPVVWTATDDSYGLSGTASKNLLIADASNQNGALKIEKGTYTWAYTMNIGSAGLAYFEMAGGSLTVNNQFNVGISGATSYFKQTGGIVNANGSWSYWGADTGTKSRIDISGGVFNAKNVSFINGTNSRIELNVNGGTMNFTEDTCFGEKNGSGSTNIVTISNGGVINVGSETAAKWMRINVAGTAVNEFYLNEEGTLAVWHVEKVGTDTGSKIVFNGGTLKSLGVDTGNNKYIIENDVTLSVEVAELGGIIDVNGHAVQLPKAITGTGTLTITNSSATAGSIAFSANVEGKVRLVGNVTATFADGVTIGGLELGAGWSGTLPAAPTISYTLDGGTVTMAYDAIGTGTNLVLKAGTIVLDMSGVTDAAVGSTATIANVSLADGVELSSITFNTCNSKYDWTASIADGVITMTAKAPEGPNKWVGGSEGNWNEDANWQYGVPETTATAEFDYDVTCMLNANKTVSNLVVNASVLFKTTNTGSVHPTIYIKEVNGDGTIGLYHAGIIANGLPGTIAEGITIDINYVSDTSDSWLEGDYSASPLKIYGKITGSGYLIFRDYTWLYGDNSGHTGKVVFQANNDGRRFMSANSGFSNSSSVAITGSSYFGFTEGTIKFNNLTWNSNGGYRGMNVLNGAKFTVELTGTSAINNKVGFFENKNTDGTWGGSWNNGCVACTIVNKGTLTTTQEYGYTLECAAGSTTTFAADNTAATINVASGATITGNASISPPTFASGAIVQQTLVDGDTVSCNTLTLNGTASVDGVKVVLGNAGVVTNITDSVTLLTATSLTGTPTMDKIAGYEALVIDNALVVKYVGETTIKVGDTEYSSIDKAVAAAIEQGLALNLMNGAVTNLSATAASWMIYVGTNSLTIIDGTLDCGEGLGAFVSDGTLTLSNVVIRAAGRTVQIAGKGSLVVDDRSMLLTTGNDPALMIVGGYYGRASADIYGVVSNICATVAADDEDDRYVISGHVDDLVGADIYLHDDALVGTLRGDSVALYAPAENAGAIQRVAGSGDDAFAIDYAYLAAEVLDPDATSITNKIAGGNGISIMNSYILGLDAKEKGSEPKIAAVEEPDGGFLRFKLENTTPREGTGAAVEYKIVASDEPGGSGEEIAVTNGAAEISAPESRVKFYRVRTVISR